MADERADTAFLVGASFGRNAERAAVKQQLQQQLNAAKSFGDEVDNDTLQDWINDL